MKQLVVEKNNPTPILWDTPIPNPGPGEILIKNYYSVVSSGTELAAIEVANTSVTDKLQNSSNIDKGLDLLKKEGIGAVWNACLLYTSPSPRDLSTSRMPSSA